MQFRQDGTVKMLSASLLRLMATAWAIKVTRATKRQDVPTPWTVYHGAPKTLHWTPPSAWVALPRKVIRNTVLQCKVKSHTDKTAPIEPFSKFVLGAPACTTCYRIVHETGATTAWFHVDALHQFDPAFVAGTVERLAGIPVRFLLIGMAAAMAAAPYTPLSIGQYINLGEFSFVNPYR